MPWVPTSRICSACPNEGAAPYQKCSVCEDAYYCSRDCQKSDWKRHKAHCKASSKKKDRLESMAMAAPLVASCIKSASYYAEAYSLPLTVAVSSALGINTLEDKTRSHVVVISLKWTCRSQDHISQQFKLIDFAAMPNAEYLKFVRNFGLREKNERDKFESAVSLERLPVPKGATDDLWIKAAYLIHVKCEEKKFRGSQTSSALEMYTVVTARSDNHLVPKALPKLRPTPPIQVDWKELFTLDTSSPPLSVAEYNDLCFKRADRPTMDNWAYQQNMLYWRHIRPKHEVLEEVKELEARSLMGEASTKILRKKAQVPNMSNQRAVPRQPDPLLEVDPVAAFGMLFFDILSGKVVVEKEHWDAFEAKEALARER